MRGWQLSKNRAASTAVRDFENASGRIQDGAGLRIGNHLLPYLHENSQLYDKGWPPPDPSTPVCPLATPRNF